MGKWVNIPWYNWYYQINIFWTIKSFKRYKKWKILKLSNVLWYFYVHLSVKWLTKYIWVHRLVLLTFEWPCPKNYEVNHKNGIRNDNRLENLEYYTSSENNTHKYKILWYKGNFQTNHPDKWKFWWKNSSSKKVNQYSLDWKFIKTWDSIIEIKRHLWVQQSNISLCCNLKRNKAWWFIWKFNNN